MLGLSVIYVATAKLGFLLAIHPGNVTAVWPPSGIALAALLIGGNRLWPGIWLGSFLANTLVFKGFGVAPVDFAVGASIAVGSVLQAVAGAAIWWTVHGEGPFAMATINESLLVLQSYVGVVTLASLILFASVSERRTASNSQTRVR